MHHLIGLILFTIIFCTDVAFATTNSLSQNDINTIRTTLQQAGLTKPIINIQHSPIAGVLSVSLQNLPVPLLISQDGRYLVYGRLEPVPSFRTSFNYPPQAVGTPITSAHKHALLQNTTALKNISTDSVFYHTNMANILWGISADGQLPFLISSDGQWLIDGTIHRINDSNIQPDTLFEHAKNRHILSLLDERTLIVYPATTPEKSTLYVATDIHCPYCRLLHKRIDELTAKGITLKIIGFDVYPESAEPMRQIWCETDTAKRTTLLTLGMQGIYPTAQCQTPTNPLAHNKHIVRPLLIMATPAIYNEHGELFEGNFRSDELLEFLNIH